MPKKTGWKSPYDGEEYEQGDPRLKGRGNPPSCPTFASENPGAGNMPLQRVVLEEEPEEEQDESTEANDNSNSGGGE